MGCCGCFDGGSWSFLVVLGFYWLVKGQCGCFDDSSGWLWVIGRSFWVAVSGCRLFMGGCV